MKKSIDYFLNIVQISLAMKPMLAKTYERYHEITGWMMSEKLDGVRAIWDGSKLISRNGNVFHAPESFLATLPAGVVLDGELWMGRGMFQRTVGVVRSHDGDWTGIKYLVFDAPEVPGDFVTRLAFAATVAEIVPHVVCTGTRHLNEHLAELVAQGAEGVMLRNPASSYEHKRSANLLKFKTCSTAEAVVIGHKANSLLVSWSKKVFALAGSLETAIGAKLTFSYQGLTDGGIPRFPIFVAVRNYE